VDHAGRVEREWASPANGTQNPLGWHVFDIDGRHGRVIAIDRLGNAELPFVAHALATNICPA